MSGYKVTYTEVPPTRLDAETYSGVLVHIRPPVQLNPDAVESYLINGDLEPLDPADLKEDNHDVKRVVLLGSTAVQTTIYASVAKKYAETLAQQVANDTVNLLHLMGAQAIIDNSPTPDA